eukprot:jgi/Galph1/2120/GphlegSOOS_G819.1
MLSSDNETYPLHVIYCGNCTMPFEYCEYNSAEEYQRCLLWRRENYPELFSNYDESLLSDSDNVSSGKKKAAVIPEVVIARAQRKGRKQVTIVHGLDSVGIKLNEFTKFCKKQLSCGASVVTTPEQKEAVEIQGDHQQETAILLKDQFSVTKEHIFFLDENKKKVKAL